MFSSIGKVKFEVDLFAVAVFQERALHGVRAREDGSDSWTYRDRLGVAVGFANVVQRCRDGPMLPYLLFCHSLHGGGSRSESNREHGIYLSC